MKTDKFLIYTLLTLSLILTACGSTSTDVNDSNTTQESSNTEDKNPPLFSTHSTTDVNENQLLAIRLAATDNSTVTYSLLSGGDSDSFDINATTGMVLFRMPPDYSLQHSYSFSAMAIDAHGNETVQEVVLTIVQDTTPPTFTSISSASVVENRNFTLQVVATDTSRVSYSIQNLDTWGEYFEINSETGILKFKSEYLPNYEITTQYNPIVKATDTSGNESTQEITIGIVNENIIHNQIRYESVLSPHTGKIWLDRNLGAHNVCSSLNNSLCYGDYFQWGRPAYGHEKFDSNAINQIADTLIPGSSFIKNDTSPFDWTTADDTGSIRSENLAKTDGSFVCPLGYRVPTIDELKAEVVGLTTSTDTFESFLKLPAAGYRSGTSELIAQGEVALLASNTQNGIYSSALNFAPIAFENTPDNIRRTYGLTIRCINNSEVDTLPPMITSPSSVSVIENRKKVMTIVAVNQSGTLAPSRASAIQTEITYSIVNLDTWGQYFDIGSKTGYLTFKDGYEPDYEIARTYYPRIKATDTAGNGTTQDIFIQVTDEEIQHKGVSYESVQSPYTGKIWLDRNVGAKRKCESSLDDENCFGDYYQWGRKTDGHEKLTSETTSTLASDIQNAGDKFILPSEYPYDWADTEDDSDARMQVWANTTGDYVCPDGFRVATLDELKAETVDVGVQNSNDAFNNFLKIPSAGYRNSDATLSDVGTIARVFTNNTYAQTLIFKPDDINEIFSIRSSGQNIRCIKYVNPEDPI